MIRCMSCIKNHDSPYLYKVKLITNSIPKKMPTSGKDVMGLSNTTIFEKGSELLVCINGKAEKYIYGDKGFTPINEETSIANSGSLKIDDDGTVYID